MVEKIPSEDFKSELDSYLNSGWQIFDKDVPAANLEFILSQISGEDFKTLKQENGSYTILVNRQEVPEEKPYFGETPEDVEEETRGRYKKAFGNLFPEEPEEGEDKRRAA